MNHTAMSFVLPMMIREKADQAHQDRVDDTTGQQAVAAGSGDGGDDEEDPFKRKLNNDGCGGDKSPADRNENDQDNDEDHEPKNGFRGEAVDVLESDNPDDFLNVAFDDDMDIVLYESVEVGVVDETKEEDMLGLWEE